MDNPKILSQIQALVELMQIGGVTESRVDDLTRLVNRLEIPYSNFSSKNSNDKPFTRSFGFEEDKRRALNKY